VCGILGYAAFDVGGFCPDVKQAYAYGSFGMAFGDYGIGIFGA
jgi:hypothetical protein